MTKLYRPRAQHTQLQKNILAAILAMTSLLANAADEEEGKVGIAGITLGEKVARLPASLRLKCTPSSVRSVSSATDGQLRRLQEELQRTRLQGNAICSAKGKPSIGRLRTAQLFITAEHGNVTHVGLSMHVGEGDTGQYSANARQYLAKLVESRYGPGKETQSKIGEKRWDPVKILHTWQLPQAKIVITDHPYYALNLSISSTATNKPEPQKAAAIAVLEDKVSKRELVLREQLWHEDARSEKTLFPAK